MIPVALDVGFWVWLGTFGTWGLEWFRVWLFASLAIPEVLLHYVQGTVGLRSLLNSLVDKPLDNKRQPQTIHMLVSQAFKMSSVWAAL